MAKKNKATEQNIVYVFYNSPHGIKFELNEQKEVVINGSPVSNIYDSQGKNMSQGKFGITEIAKQDWEEIVKLYKDLPIFKSERIFASDTLSFGNDKAKEQALQINGAEQIDIKQTNTKPDFQSASEI